MTLKPGDDGFRYSELPEPYYEDELTIVYHAKLEEIAHLFPDDYADAIVTDPPYEAEAHGTRRRIKAGGIVADALPFGQMTEPLRALAVSEAKRICRGWSIFFCQAEAIGAYQKLMAHHYRRPLLWFKPDAPPQLTGDRPSMAFESMTLSHHAGFAVEDETDGETMVASWHAATRSVWAGRGKKGVYVHNCTDYVHEHPTQKSLPLMLDLLKDFAPDPGMLIVDFFGGGGTTAVAAKMRGQKAIVIEMTEEWCEVAAVRLEKTMPGSRPAKRQIKYKQDTLTQEIAW